MSNTTNTNLPVIITKYELSYLYSNSQPKTIDLFSAIEVAVAVPSYKKQSDNFSLGFEVPAKILNQFDISQPLPDTFIKVYQLFVTLSTCSTTSMEAILSQITYACCQAIAYEMVRIQLKENNPNNISMLNACLTIIKQANQTKKDNRAKTVAEEKNKNTISSDYQIYLGDTIRYDLEIIKIQAFAQTIDKFISTIIYPDTLKKLFNQIENLLNKENFNQYDCLAVRTTPNQLVSQHLGSFIKIFQTINWHATHTSESKKIEIMKAQEEIFKLFIAVIKNYPINETAAEDVTYNSSSSIAKYKENQLKALLKIIPVSPIRYDEVIISLDQEIELRNLMVELGHANSLEEFNSNYPSPHKYAHPALFPDLDGNSHATTLN